MTEREEAAMRFQLARQALFVKPWYSQEKREAMEQLRLAVDQTAEAFSGS